MLQFRDGSEILQHLENNSVFDGITRFEELVERDASTLLIQWQIKWEFTLSDVSSIYDKL